MVQIYMHAIPAHADIMGSVTTLYKAFFAHAMEIMKDRRAPVGIERFQ